MNTSIALLMLASAFGLQPTGTFHAGEPVARNGEAWLALRLRGHDAALVPVHARVATVRDAFDEEGAPPTGQAVTVDGMPEATVLVRGPGLRAGAVQAAASRPAAPNALAGPLEFMGRRYLIETRCPGDSAAAPRCDVVLVHGAVVQTLFGLTVSRFPDGNVQYGDDATPALLFAGDLDRDGRLDLVLDITDHYNVSRPVLYLSSKAGAGELVHEVARHESVGC